LNTSLLAALVMAVASPPLGSSDVAPAPAPLTVDATGECPSGRAVAAALWPVVGGDARHLLPAAPHVTDLGDSFEITARGQTQRYVDAPRDCEERARMAAVFIALALNPPTFEAPAPAGPPAGAIEAKPSIRTPPPAPAASAGWLSLAIDARLDGGGAPAAEFAPGAELRAGVGRQHFGVVAAAGVLAPTEARYVSVPVRQQRFPLSLALTGRRNMSGALEAAVALGVALVPFTLRGSGLTAPEPAVRLDVGARLAIELRFPALSRRMTPFVDLHAEYFPRPYVIDVDPLGDIGTTGHLWVGASLGVGFETGGPGP
jgi:hypothetical protein